MSHRLGSPQFTPSHSPNVYTTNVLTTFALHGQTLRLCIVYPVSSARLLPTVACALAVAQCTRPLFLCTLHSLGDLHGRGGPRLSRPYGHLTVPYPFCTAFIPRV